MQARAGGVRGEADRVLKVRGGGQRTVRPTGDTEATRNAHYCGIRPEPFRPSLRSATSPVRGGFCGLRPNKAHTACGASGTPLPTGITRKVSHSRKWARRPEDWPPYIHYKSHNPNKKAGANISFAPAVLLLRSHSLITLFRYFSDCFRIVMGIILSFCEF